MGDHGRDVLIGLFMGALIVMGVFYLIFNWSAEQIQMASLPVSPPLFFIPK